MNQQEPRVIVALDFPDKAAALALVAQLDPQMCRLKVGKEMFTRLGPDFVEHLVKLGYDVFLDLKYYDIPNTVAAACDVAADLGVWMLNVHASGGRKMMETARERLARHSKRPLLIGVTILTSFAESDLHEIGLKGSAEENVLRLARLTEHAGLDGVVCSPLEVMAIRKQLATKDFKLVTPGVRPKTATLDDQQRVMTPADAICAGSDYLVIGRPISGAEDPLASLQAINAEIATVV